MFNASEFDEGLKISFFKELFNVSKTHRLLYLYDYFKAPERLVDISKLDTASLLDFYRFALDIANEKQK